MYIFQCNCDPLSNQTSLPKGLRVRDNVYVLIIYTWLQWDLRITVGVLCSLGYELDPVLDLCHPGIDAMAGALASIAHHTNLG